MAYCTRCGSAQDEDAAFCTQCGKPSAVDLKSFPHVATVANSEILPLKDPSGLDSRSGVASTGDHRMLGPIPGLALSLILLITASSPWANLPGSLGVLSNAAHGYDFAGGWIVLVVAFAQICMNGYEAVARPDSRFRFRFGFTYIVLNTLAIVGLVLAANSVRSQNAAFQFANGYSLNIQMLGAFDAAGFFAVLLAIRGGVLVKTFASSHRDAQRLPSSTSVVSPVAYSSSVAEEIGKLASLRDRGLLTDEEFEKQKKRILEG